ncbi:efflux RND transporter periplasmic adaptor subunit [candidate division CSSED10-310 bacterium]|uniref:Efflux RND transporter periplasmic adaptor subunit n=1 Tax=candidate division CSSED10-310 bacterium TaxID=2855610 RepID=A0ABV6YSM5_UNCC1
MMNIKSVHNLKKGFSAILFVLALAFLWACSEPRDEFNPWHRPKVIIPVKVASIKTADMDFTIQGGGLVSSRFKVSLFIPCEGLIELKNHGKNPLKLGQVVPKNTILATVDNEIKTVNFKSAQLDHERMQHVVKQLQLAIQQNVKPKDELDQAQFHLKAARLRMELMKQELELAEIVSPVKATITQLETYVEGQYVSAGQLFAILEDMENMMITISVPVAEAQNVKPEQQARVNVEGIPNTTFHGFVSEVGLRVNQNDRTLPVKIAVLNSNNNIRPGMFARVTIITQSIKNVVSIPLHAVQRKESKDFIFVVGKKSFDSDYYEAEKRTVDFGIKSKTHIHVVRGLKDGEQVLISPPRYLLDGALIDIR